MWIFGLFGVNEFVQKMYLTRRIDWRRVLCNVDCYTSWVLRWSKFTEITTNQFPTIWSASWCSPDWCSFIRPFWWQFFIHGRFSQSPDIMLKTFFWNSLKMLCLRGEDLQLTLSITDATSNNDRGVIARASPNYYIILGPKCFLSFNWKCMTEIKWKIFSWQLNIFFIFLLLIRRYYESLTQLIWHYEEIIDFSFLFERIDEIFLGVQFSINWTRSQVFRF